MSRYANYYARGMAFKLEKSDDIIIINGEIARCKY